MTDKEAKDLIITLRKMDKAEQGLSAVTGWNVSTGLYGKVADAIEALLERDRWISVEERLPEMHDEVLVCNEDYGETELGFATVAVLDGSDWVNTWDRKGSINCVTHWMPLPEPPNWKMLNELLTKEVNNGG